MIYNIGDKVMFNTENGSLKSMENNKEVFLSSLNTRVFQCLIEHGVKPVSRKEIFIQVWDDHGLKATSATLNQYVSLTRRALSTLGFSEHLIITVAKTGYRINKSIQISEVLVEPIGPPLADMHATTLIAGEGLTEKASHYLVISLRILSIALPLAILVFLFYYYQHHREDRKRQLITYLGRVNGCQVYYTGKYLDNRSDSYMKYLSDNNLYGNRCEKDEIIITRTNNSLYVTEDSGRRFIAKCVIDRNSLYHHCESEYIRAWKKS